MLGEILCEAFPLQTDVLLLIGLRLGEDGLDLVKVGAAYVCTHKDTVGCSYYVPSYDFLLLSN